MLYERLLTVNEVAAYLGITKNTLFNMTYAGRGPKRIKVGATVRYRESDVQEFVKQCEERR